MQISLRIFSFFSFFLRNVDCVQQTGSLKTALLPDSAAEFWANQASPEPMRRGNRVQIPEACGPPQHISGLLIQFFLTSAPDPGSGSSAALGFLYLLKKKKKPLTRLFWLQKARLKVLPHHFCCGCLNGGSGGLTVASAGGLRPLHGCVSGGVSPLTEVPEAEAELRLSCELLIGWF